MTVGIPHATEGKVTGKDCILTSDKCIHPEIYAHHKQGVANVEEARCLWADGWTYLDVRPALEIDEMGKVAGSVCVPVKNMTKVRRLVTLRC